MDWFARGLIPRLERGPTVEQIAGGWRIAAERIVSIEDKLTTLEATAIDERDRGHAHTLRSAVRAARAQLAALDTVSDTFAASDLLRSAAAHLETALSSVDAAAQASPARPR